MTNLRFEKRNIQKINGIFHQKTTESTRGILLGASIHPGGSPYNSQKKAANCQFFSQKRKNKIKKKLSIYTQPKQTWGKANEIEIAAF